MCVYHHRVFTAFLAHSDVVFEVGNVQEVMHLHTVTRGLIEEEASLDALVLEITPFCWLSHRFGCFVIGDKCGQAARFAMGTGAQQGVRRAEEGV